MDRFVNGIVRHMGDYWLIQYTHGTVSDAEAKGVDEWSHCPDELKVYMVHVDPTEPLCKQFSWVNWFDVASTCGIESLQGSQCPKPVAPCLNMLESVSIVEAIAGYYGWHELDHEARNMPVSEISEAWGK